MKPQRKTIRKRRNRTIMEGEGGSRFRPFMTRDVLICLRVCNYPVIILSRRVNIMFFSFLRCSSQMMALARKPDHLYFGLRAARRSGRKITYVYMYSYISYTRCPPPYGDLTNALWQTCFKLDNYEKIEI